MATLTLEDLLALEHEGWRSLCEGRGGSFYKETMTADGLMILVNGMVLDRPQVAASLDDAPTWETYEITEPRLVPLGDDSAALTYRATAGREGQAPFVAVMSSTYRLSEGRPRLALYQQTTVTH